MERELLNLLEIFCNIIYDIQDLKYKLKRNDMERSLFCSINTVDISQNVVKFENPVFVL